MLLTTSYFHAGCPKGLCRWFEDFPLISFRFVSTGCVCDMKCAYRSTNAFRTCPREGIQCTQGTLTMALSVLSVHASALSSYVILTRRQLRHSHASSNEASCMTCCLWEADALPWKVGRSGTCADAKGSHVAHKEEALPPVSSCRLAFLLLGALSDPMRCW